MSQLREARFGEVDRVIELVLRQRRANAHFGQRAAGAELLIVGAREHARELFEVAAQERRFAGAFDQRLHQLRVIGCRAAGADSAETARGRCGST